MKFSVAALLIGTASAFSPAFTTKTKTPTALNLAVGETAPEFSLVDQNGRTFSYKNNKPLVVYFYPADSTPGCTVQAQSFNEEVKDIRKKYSANVVGISGQDVDSKQKFAAELGLDYSILADEGDKVRKAFKVPKAAFGLFPGRVTYVLDKVGKCVSVYDNLGDAKSHVVEAKKALDEIKSSSPSNPLTSLFN